MLDSCSCALIHVHVKWLLAFVSQLVVASDGLNLADASCKNVVLCRNYLAISFVAFLHSKS